MAKKNRIKPAEQLGGDQGEDTPLTDGLPGMEQAGGEDAPPATPVGEDGVEGEDTPPAPPQAGGEDGVDEVDEVDGVDPREIDVDSVEDVESLRAIARGLQEHCAELGAHMASAIKARDAALKAEPIALPLEGEFSEVLGLLPLGERTELAVEVRRTLPRTDLAHFVPGDVVAVITMATGWNLNALVDHVREGYCGEKHS